MLDNPIWHSLSTRHSHLAIGHGLAKRYPKEATPFVAVSEPSEEAARDLEAIVEPGERIGILSVIPPLGEGWQVAKEIEIHQYVFGVSSLESGDGVDSIKLGPEHVPAMLELTALVYPAYFREGTAALGDYFGLFEGPRLVSMAGIRMAMPGYQEISAICTHPDHQGKGYGSRITKHLVRHIRDQGEVAFLHTESDNPAKSMYEKVGFRLHQVLPFRVMDRCS